MAYYTQYEKLQKYYKDGIAVVPAEYKKGTNLGVAEYSSLEECETHSTIWKIVNNEYICDRVSDTTNLWNQYQKLQRYEEDGKPYVPEQFKKGKIVKENIEFEYITDCEYGYHWILIKNDYLCENNEDETYTKYQKIEKVHPNGDSFVPPVYKKGNPIVTKPIYKNETNITYDGFLSHTITTVNKTNDRGETYTIISQTDSVDKIDNIANNTLCGNFKSKGSKLIYDYSTAWNDIIEKDENIRLASSNLTYNKSDSLHLVLRMGLKLKSLERNSSYTWSENELNFIIKNYTNMSDEKISKELGISKSKICRKRIEMGLIKQKKEPFLQGGYYRQYTNGKKVWTHRYNAEKKIGRKLKNFEPVHHKDGNKTNNDYDNLYVCKDKAEHGAVHDSLEKVAFELYKRGLIRFNEETGEYYLNEQIRTEG